MKTTGGTVPRRLTVSSSTRRHEAARILNPDDPETRPADKFNSSSEFSQIRETVVSHRSTTHPFRRRRSRPKAKQEQVLQELFSISRKRLVRVAYGILQNQQDAEDAVQDAFLSAFRHFGNFEGRSAVATWLTRIVINAALMLRRTRKNKFVRSLHDLNGDDAVFVETIPDLQPNPELAHSRAESFAFLDALINKMNPLLRQAVKIAYYDELSSPEASSALAIPISTYKARLFRGTRLLQNRVRRQMQKFITMS
jgi:RNA polymerase sigma-70 factor (ECF subfamily)